MEDDREGEERAAQRASERVLAKARAQRKRRELQRQACSFLLLALLLLARASRCLLDIAGY